MSTHRTITRRRQAARAALDAPRSLADLEREHTEAMEQAERLGFVLLVGYLVGWLLILGLVIFAILRVARVL